LSTTPTQLLSVAEAHEFLDYVHNIVLAMDGGVVAPVPAPFSAELTPSPARHAGGPADFGERAQLQCAHPRLRFLCRMAGEPTPHDAAVRAQV
jgi:hypothetical protein